VPVKDVAETDFATEVIQRSYERPVVVDFWAAWCGPCRTLGPVLERVADSHAGDVELVKVDVDANPRLADAFQVRGIPAVKAFRNGAVVGEFVGAYPEEAVKQFFTSILPTGADRLAAAGASSNDPEEAERSFRRALEDDPGHREAILGLSELLADRGDLEEASALLARLPEDADVRRLKAEIELIEAAREAGPGDPLSAAGQNGDWRPALEQLLEEVREGDREDARQKMVDIFEVLGPEHELTREYRTKLAAALF